MVSYEAITRVLAAIADATKQRLLIPRESVDHKVINQLHCEDLLLRSEALHHNFDAARALACGVLGKYLPDVPFAIKKYEIVLQASRW